MVYVSGGNELLDPEKIFKRLGIKAGMTVADLGCGGAGHFVIPAGQTVGEDGTVYAVDVVKSVLYSVATRARSEGLKNIKTVWSDLEILGATRIIPESLDAAFLINILFQSKQHEYIFKEAIRLLKPDGKLLVIDWGHNISSLGPNATDRVKVQELKDIANNLNLKLIEEFEAGTYHYGLIFQKQL